MDNRILYHCPSNPRHMSSVVNTFAYELPYKEIMGGVTAMRRKHFEMINGFSNIYFGWVISFYLNFDETFQVLNVSIFYFQGRRR
jgi:hypothetical protein